MKNFFTEKKIFTVKNINENVKNIYLISKICFYTENVCLTNKIFLKIFLKYIFILQKDFLIIKIYLLIPCCELNNLVLKVLEAGNLWYSLKHFALPKT